MVCDAFGDLSLQTDEDHGGDRTAVAIVIEGGDYDAHSHYCSIHLPTPIGWREVKETNLRFFCRRHQVDLIWDPLAEGPYFELRKDQWSVWYETMDCPKFTELINAGEDEEDNECGDSWVVMYDTST